MSCHTEALAEVSINLRCVLNSVDFSPFYKRLKMTAVVWIFRYAQNDKVRFLCPSLRASKASVAIHKFKQTLSQKFKQSLKNPKNSANRPQAHHKKISVDCHAVFKNGLQ